MENISKEREEREEYTHKEKKEESIYKVRILGGYSVPECLHGLHSIEEISERVAICKLENFKLENDMWPSTIQENPCVVMIPNKYSVLYFANCSENRIYTDRCEIKIDEKTKEDYKKNTGEEIKEDKIIFDIYYTVNNDGDFCFYVENNFYPAFYSFPKKLYNFLKEKSMIPQEFLDKIDRALRRENIILSLPPQMVSSLFIEMESKKNELQKRS
jgi:hypothetical protein